MSILFNTPVDFIACLRNLCYPCPMMTAEVPQQTGWRGSEDLWIAAAYDLLIAAGIDSVKVMPLARKLGLSRTSFYHHFSSREALLHALVDRWKARNTGNLIARTETYADSITEAVFNLFDCWVDPILFDAKLDFAIRNWAQSTPDLKQTLEAADQDRMAAIMAMFQRFGYCDDQAETRARTVYYTQVGYIAMMVSEPLQTRLSKMPGYVETFTGKRPTPAETARFLARHENHAP